MTDLVITAEGVTMLAAGVEWQVLPVLWCPDCQGDRPVVPLAGGAYRCSACGMLYDPSERHRTVVGTEIGALLRTAALVAEAGGNVCRARAFETAAEIAESYDPSEAADVDT